jgi:hypothetical protein
LALTPRCKIDMSQSKAKIKKRKGEKRKLSPEEKRQKKLNRELYETIFINGKQKRVRRAPTIDGIPVDEFIARNADPIWLLQNGYYELLHERECARDADRGVAVEQTSGAVDEDGDIPF